MAIIRVFNENDVVSYVAEQLEPYFYIKHEVKGKHIIRGNKRIDMVIYPKPILIENEFPKIPIGIEIKTNFLIDGNKKQVIELFHQAIGYRHTRFELKTCLQFLPLILVYPPMSNYLKNETEEFRKGFEHIGSRLAGKYFIGELLLPRDCKDCHFKIRLCGSDYYKFNGTGKRFNLNWGFERYEEQKEIIKKQYPTPDEYDRAINTLSELLGL
jgi:hypothetical protein